MINHDKQLLIITIYCDLNNRPVMITAAGCVQPSTQLNDRHTFKYYYGNHRTIPPNRVRQDTVQRNECR